MTTLYERLENLLTKEEIDLYLPEPSEEELQVRNQEIERELELERRMYDV